jgi:hypothetical protein
VSAVIGLGKCLSVGVVCLTLIHCSNMRKSGGAAGGRTVEIALKGAEGDKSETRYYSSSRTLTYNGEQLVRDKTESVDFTINTNYTFYDPKTSVLKFRVTTTRKDGKVELHDLAFPELRETIDYVVVGKTGQVIQAGAYPPQGIFYVPSIPIPKEPVAVGDTWTMEHTWLSATDSIPLKLEIVGILKDIVSCEGGKTCADIELSGGVELDKGIIAKGTSFQSKLWGRMLFSIDRGDVIWSEMRSNESMNVPGERFAITSCTRSETRVAKEFKTKLDCEPKDVPVTQVPKM